MSVDKEIRYTENAKQRLERFHSEVQDDLEKYLLERKFVPGDDFIEVTASDIDNVVQKLKIVTPIRVNRAKTLLPVVYILAGVILTAIGIFYEQFQKLLQGDPIRLVFVISGVIMILISWVYLIMLRAEVRIEQLKRDAYEYEKARNELNKTGEL